MTPTTQIPLRASADIEPNRVISRSGAYTAAKTANETTEPIGVSADWTVQPPIVDYGLSTLHARGAQADPVSFYGRGEKCYVRVGTTAISAGGGRVKVMADGSGRVIPYVLGAAATWSVGYTGDAAAPVGSLVELFVDPVLHPLT
jgi:hypothetical protein